MSKKLILLFHYKYRLKILKLQSLIITSNMSHLDNDQTTDVKLGYNVILIYLVQSIYHNILRRNIYIRLINYW